MSLIEEDLAAIDALLSAAGDSRQTDPLLAQLRRRLPGLVCLACDAADVLEDPYRSYAALDLHLIDTQGHCAAMTGDPLRATGVLVARKVPT